MERMQRCLGFRNASATKRASALALLALLAALISAAACDWFIPDQSPSTPVEDPAPNPDPNPNPNPDPVSTTLTRAPYLQSLGRTSVVIAFRTQSAVGTTVDYGTTLDYGASQTDGSTPVHAVELRNLTPGERYFYRVRVGDQTLAGGESFYFDTDAGASDPEFSFFVAGDLGDSGGILGVTGQRLLVTTPRAEIGLLTGDIVYPDGEASDYDAKLMKPLAGVLRNVAVWPALGNHDWHVDPAQNFELQWVLPNNEHYYSFDRGNAHFIALDTQDGQIYDRANQVAWLRADLAAHRNATWTFAYYHHPGYTCTYKGYDQTVIQNFQPVFDEYGVDVVFEGHAHTYERLYPLHGSTVVDRNQDPNYVDPGGTIYMIVGCGSKTEGSTTPDCDINAVAIDRTVMFALVTVRGNELTIRAIESESGRVRDTVTIRKNPV
jgi:hypothetical protein